MPALTGAQIVTLAKERLAGYQNAIDDITLLSYLNEGKDEVWAAIKSLNDNYFVTNSTLTLDPAVREYTLPSNLRELIAVEVTGPSEFEHVIFEHRDLAYSEFQDARRDANVDSTDHPLIYFYSIVGKDQFVLSHFPETAFILKLWYVKELPDFANDATPLDEILFPYVRRIADYAVKKAMLALQDQPQFEAWRKEWRDGLGLLAAAANRRVERPEHVVDFLG